MVLNGAFDGATLDRRRRRVRPLGEVSRLIAQGDDNVIAVHLGGVRHQAVHVDDHAGASVGFGRQHRVDAAGTDVDAPRRERQVVFGRSNAMRAGLSMVNGIGSGAGPLRCNLSCTCCPDNV
jgi:hypothetical protein